MLSIQSVKVSSPAFSLQGWTGPLTLARGHSTRVVLLFTPPSQGSYSGTLSIASQVKLPITASPIISSENGVLTTATVALSGTAVAGPGTPQISITPGSIQLKSGQSEQYAASVTGMTNPAVTWSAALGIISYGGLYTAPLVKSATADTITATSVSSPSTHTTASVTIQPAALPAPTPPAAGIVTVNVSPASPSVQSGQSQQFTAAVGGATNPAVTWTAAHGTITSSGLYIAPTVQSASTDTVSATSVASASTIAAIQVKVTVAPASPTAPAPPPAPAPAPTTPVVGGLYISPDGADSNPGTEAQPWKTFGHAIPALNPGATLVLEDGTYNASTTGLLSVNCSSGANNGTAGAPITVIARDERQAQIEGGGYSGVSVNNCSYWTIEGLYVTNTDVNLYPCSNHNINIINSQNISIIRNVVDHTNGYCNAHGIGVNYGNGKNLIKENEVYDFHRHGIAIGFHSGDNIVRNYMNPRGRTDVSGCVGSACQSSGHFGIVGYPLATSEFDNNIAEGMQTIIAGNSGVGFDQECDYSPGNCSGNSWLGNVVLNGQYGYRSASRCGNGELCNNQLQVINTTIADFVAYQSIADSTGTSLNIYPRSTYNSQFNHITQIGFAQSQGGTATAGFIADYQCVTSGGSSGAAGGGVYSVSANNSLFENNGQGINSPTPSTCEGASISYTSGFDHDAFFNDGTAIAGGSVTNQVNLSSNQLGSCVLWVPSSAASLSRKASDGRDIGATVLYEYASGTVTSTPLWTASGQFAAVGAATADGLNRISGESLADVGTRLNVNQNGCSFPSGYTPAP